jgi:hypothetical protein
MKQDEIYKQLGLEEPEGFKLEAHWHMCDLHFQGMVPEKEVFTRRWGKTTRTIVAALEHLSENPEEVVLLLNTNLHLAKSMEKQARDWAWKLGLRPDRIKGRTTSSRHLSPSESVRGFDLRQVFMDPDVSLSC